MRKNVQKHGLSPRSTAQPRPLRAVPYAGIAVAVLFLLIQVHPRCASAEWYTEAELSASHDDNVNLAADKDDRKYDVSETAHVLVGRHIQLGGTTGIEFSAEVKDAVYSRYEGLDHQEAGLTLSVKQKTGMGSFVPWFRVFGSAAYTDYRESPRSGSYVSGGAEAGERLSERLFGQVGYRYETTTARNQVFDSRESIFSVRGRYLLTETSQVFLSYGAGHGSNVLTEGVAPGYIPSSDEIMIDTFGAPMVTYHVSTRIQTMSAGVVKELDRNWSLSLGFDYYEVHAEGERYPRDMYSGRVVFAY